MGESAKADFRPVLVLGGFACLLTAGYFGVEPLRAAAGRLGDVMRTAGWRGAFASQLFFHGVVPWAFFRLFRTIRPPRPALVSAADPRGLAAQLARRDPAAESPGELGDRDSDGDADLCVPGRAARGLHGAGRRVLVPCLRSDRGAVVGACTDFRQSRMQTPKCRRNRIFR